MRIGELATAAGISRDTLRFYETLGLVQARRLDNGYRDYPPDALMLVQYIRTAQQLGFTLEEIGRKMPEIWKAADPTTTIAQVLTEKLADIDMRIEALRALRAQLAARIPLDCPLVAAT